MDNYKDWHPNFPTSLESCDKEPIHIPGAIQEYGVLFCFEESTGKILALSQNALSYVKELKSFETQFLNISDYFTWDAPRSLRRDHPAQFSKTIIEIKSKVPAFESCRFALLHRLGDRMILEVELECPDEPAAVREYLSDLPLMIKDVNSHETVDALAEFIAAKVRKLTGFDRVMVYKYDQNWNGVVIAEEKRAYLESFLGLHYPASDIPPQARALYEKNWIRIIPTVDYRPSVIVPTSMQGIDLSQSILRSVSPIHIQYLKNMGVGASMSVSLIRDGKLWGLIACHHYSEHFVPLRTRAGCESFAQLVSSHIKNLETKTALAAQYHGEELFRRVLDHFSNEVEFEKATKHSSKELLELFDAHGLIISLGDENVKIGQVPSEDHLAQISKLLARHSIVSPLVVDEVASVIPSVSDSIRQDFAGFMALPLSARHDYYIICFRPEEQRTVEWAGKPKDKIKIDPNDPQERLIPRGSFALWAELYEGHSRPWTPFEIENLKKFALVFVKLVIERREISEKSNRELRALNEAKDEFVATVSHELRTPLNSIIGWTDLALSGSLGDERIPEALRVIQRNARSQNQLISDLLDVSRIISGKMKISVRNFRVSEVIEAVALSFQPAAEAKGIKMISNLNDSSDSIIGDPQRIQQVIWNILSNAIKFSPKNSKVWLTLTRKNSHMVLAIQDQGIGIDADDLVKIFARFEQVDSSVSRGAGGLGLGLSISKHIVELHGGYIEAHSDGLSQGAIFKVYLPIAPVASVPEGEHLPIDDMFTGGKPIVGRSTTLEGQVILIVEDEHDAIKFLNLLIQAHGAKTYLAHNGIEALEIIERKKDAIGIVLSDVGMEKMDGYSLARAIRSSSDEKVNSLCMVALTAFGRPQDRVTALKAGFDSYIAKPVMQDELIAVLETVCKKKGPWFPKSPYPSYPPKS